MKPANKYPLDTTLKRNLAREMQEQGFNMKELSLKSGLGETAVRDILASKKEVYSIDTINKLALRLNTSSRDLLYGGNKKIPLRGLIMSGLTIEPVKDELTRILPEGAEYAPGMEVYEFKDDSNAPLAYEGWLYFIEPKIKVNIPTDSPSPFLVQIKGGERVIRKIVKSHQKTGHFTLVHPITLVPTENVGIEWCAKIRHIITK